MQRYHNSVQDPAGDAVYNALITVTEYPSNVAATVYSDDGLTVLSQVRTDENGMFEFYAPDGKYNLTVTGERIQTYIMYDVLIDDSLSNTTVIATLSTVANISALKALTFVTDKTNVSTLGYSTAGDGGAATYYYDASDTTSADDGYKVIVTNGGQRAKLITNNIFSVSQAGAVGGSSIVTSKIQAVVNAASIAAAAGNEPVIDLNGYTHVVDTTIEIPATNITMRSGGLKAHSTFFNDAGGLYLGAIIGLKSSLTRVHLYEMVIDGQYYASGIYNNGSNTDTSIDTIEVKNAKDFGIYLDTGGLSIVRNCILTQSQNVAALRTGDGLYVGTGDCKVYNNTIRYWNRCVVVASGTMLFEGNHVYNGSPAGIDTPLPNSINIEVLSGSNCVFNGNYIDKGSVILRNKFASLWTNNIYLFNTVPIHECIFYFDCVDAVGKPFPTGWIHNGNLSTTPISSGTMDFIKFIASGTGSWATESAAITPILTAEGRLPNCNGPDTAHVVGDSNYSFMKSETDGMLKFTGYGVTNTPLMDWGDKKVLFRSPGFTQITAASGTDTNGTFKVEGSKTAVAVASSLKLADRRGSSDLNLSDTDLGFYEWVLYGNTGTNQGKMALLSSVPGSATVTTELTIRDTDILPGTNNNKALGSSSLRFSELWASKLHLFPSATATMTTDGELTILMAADGKSVTFKSRVAGVSYSSAAITLS